MIGVSLSYKQAVKDAQLPEFDRVLQRLWQKGARSIELRMVPAKADPAEVRRMADLLWDHGFRITVHGTTKTAETAVEDVLVPLEELLAHRRQPWLTVTVHPVVGDNAAMLRALSDYAYGHGHPIQIALENERRLPDKTEGDSLSLVLAAVTEADRENVGICFDMGHLAWYYRVHTDDPYQLPPKEFLSRVIHTHVHTCVDGETHFPLSAWEGAVASYVEALDYGYFGVYNIEISPKKYAHLCSAEEGYLTSVDTLRSNFPFHASLYEDLKLHYDHRFRKALEVLDRTEGSSVALVGPSSYLFSTGGLRWAMDVAFRNLRFLSETPSRIGEYLKDLQLMILTHAHADHAEDSTIRALAQTGMDWIVPEFVEEKMQALGVSADRLITVRPGETVHYGTLTVRVLPGRHYRPDTGKGCEAVGYLITAEDAPSMAFPGDVRDFSTEGVEALSADYCFAHVWLTDFATEPNRYIPKAEELAAFMLRMSSRNVILGHLYENGRRESGMWQLHHAHLVGNVIRRQSPDTKVTVPQCGEILALTK